MVHAGNEIVEMLEAITGLHGFPLFVLSTAAAALITLLAIWLAKRPLKTKRATR